MELPQLLSAFPACVIDGALLCHLLDDVVNMSGFHE
jgi:hypothetical protein